MSSVKILSEVQHLNLSTVQAAAVVNTFSNFGSPPLYFDTQQHREAILEGAAASSIQPPCPFQFFSIDTRTAQFILSLCSSLYVDGFRFGEFRMAGLTSAL